MTQALSDRTRLEHILEAADTVLQQYRLLPNGQLPDGDFRYYAFIKCVEIIGEAAYRLSREFRKHTAKWNGPKLFACATFWFTTITV